MEKMILLKEKLVLIWKRILQAYADHRVAVSATALLTICAAVESFLYIFVYDEREKMWLWKCFDYSGEVYIALLLFICGAIFTESLLPYGKTERRAKAARLVCFLLAAVIAAVISLGFMKKGPMQHIFAPGSAAVRWLGQFALCYVLLLLLGTVYFCHKRSSVGFIEYILHVFVNGAIATAVYVVLCIGVGLVLMVVEILFVKNAVGDISSTGIILITGLYYAPACLNALHNTDSSIDDPLSKFLLRYVMTGLTICALAVVYVYLLKILILWEIPSNEIFGIVTGLFCIGMPIWVIDYHYRDESRYMRLVQKLPYALIPLFPVQAYAIGVRIYEHGMTPSRYMGVFIILIEIAALLLWHFWRDHMERAIPVLCVCVIVSFMAPGINMQSLSNRWQRTYLETYYHKLLEQGSLTELEIDRLEGAYNYFRWNKEMEALINQYDIYEENFASLLAETGTDMETFTELDSHSVHCCQMVGSLDVSAYSSFDMLNQDVRYDAYNDDLKIPVDFSAFRFYKRGKQTEGIITVDLSDFAERCMAYEKERPNAGEEEITAAMKPYQKVMLDDGRVLYLNHFKVRWQDGIKDGKAYFEIDSVEISGMLLEK